MHYTRFLVVAALALVAVLLSCGSARAVAADDSNPATNNTATFTPKGMVLIQAEGKSFQMGSVNGFSDEQPVHAVSFTHDFWMDTTEVTQKDYDSLMSAAYVGYSGTVWINPYGVGDLYPAYSLYWGDAALYCNARSKRDGLDTVYTYTGITGTPGSLCELENVVIDYSRNGYRLPTEAEWEYACRAGSTTDYFWGRDFDPYPSSTADTTEFNTYAVWYANSWWYGADVEEFGAYPVASKTPSAYNLYDMSGNVYEWCNDWYGAYDGAAEVDPVGPDSAQWHCLRGGSWGNHAIYLRSANRTLMFPDYTYYFIGFRVVLPATAEPPTQTVVINELMADNGATAADQDGEYDDWVELYNPGAETVSLAGLFLSDRDTEPTQWAFPDTTIPAGGYLIVWTDEDTVQTGLHAGFKLSANGEAVYLFNSQGALVDQVSFGSQTEDVSYGRYPDGSESFQRMYPSFAGPNTGGIPEVEDYDGVLFGDTLIHTIDLQFYVANWAESLKYNFEVLDEVYMPARMVFDDTLVLDSIGVRYKGNSSYVASGSTPKKPFEFKFDKYINNQLLMGVKKLNVHNGVNDPTYMRETLAYGIARMYMPAPRTAYGNVFVDGELLGLYVLVEQVDKPFLSLHFPDNDGNLFKASDNGGYLAYHGTDQSAYESEYELKTNEDVNDWSRLISFIDVLNNTDDSNFIAALQGWFDIDSGLRLLAFNMVLSNFDSYTGSGRNFYLYDDSTTGLIVILPWDFNESFGVYTNNWDVFTQDIAQISNLNQRPLNKRLLAQSSLQLQYRDYIADMIVGPASYDSVSAMIDRLKPLLDASVQADTNKLYTYQDFVTNTDADIYVGLGKLIPGLKAFSQARNANLAEQLADAEIYPGDADNNGVVNALDVLPIGVYFLTTGPARSTVTSTWAMQQAQMWHVPAATYADANGDGVVDEKDVVSIGVNWGNAHDKTAVSYEIDVASTALSEQAKNTLSAIYNSLSGSSEPVAAMKALLESILTGGSTTTATPLVFSLDQNYPNPFNPTTTIAFSLPGKQLVTLTIYDIMGRIAFQPIPGQYFDAGQYHYLLDFAGYPSGIYFCRIKTEQGSLVRKLSLIK